MRDAEALSTHLARFEISRIVCSPYLRARQTAEPYARVSGISVDYDDRLVERRIHFDDRGAWRNRLRQSFADGMLAFDGWETHSSALHRIQGVFADIRSSGDSCVLIVSHAVLMTLLLQSLDSRFGFDTWAMMRSPTLYSVRLEGEICSVSVEGGPAELTVP